MQFSAGIFSYPTLAQTMLLALFVFVAVPILAAATDGGGCLPARCGDVTVSAPFGLVSGTSEENRCAEFGFQVHCAADIPYLGYYELDYSIRILHIFYGNASLLVSDAHKLADFDGTSPKGCHVPKANTASKIGRPFLISPLNRNLVFYNCTRAPAQRTGLVETVCRNNTFVRAGGRYRESGEVEGGYALPGCNATAVPVLGPEYGDVDASDYLELISAGFLLTWQPPPAGSSTGE